MNIRNIIIAGFVILCIDVLLSYLLSYKVSDSINLFIAMTTFLSIFFAVYQLQNNHKWNLKHTAMTEAHNGREKYTEAIKSLNDSIQYREAVSPYSLKEIHKYLCDEEDHTKNPSITDTGKNIKHNIFVILNYFEYIAVGVKNNVYDETIIKDLLIGGMTKADLLFGEYVKHLREKHVKDKLLFTNFQFLVNKWKSDE